MSNEADRERNPFTPNFGQVPIRMAGRDFIVSEIERAFEAAPGDPSLTTIIQGARGTGKTALLTYLARIAEQHGWIAVDVTCIPGMLEDIKEQSRRKASPLLKVEGGRRLSGVGVGQLISLEWDNAEQPVGNWRSQMTDLVEGLNEQGVGLVITVDEIDPGLDEMVQLAAVYQHFVREDRKVALLMAGLPQKVSALLNDRSVSFLRRASQQRLGRIEDYEVEEAFRRTVEEFGKKVDDDAMALAVEAIGGFPYMMQLVGFRAWQRAEGKGSIDAEAMESGIAMAGKDMESRVLRATLDELSEGDLAFLEAMLSDEASSATADIAGRMGKSASYVSTYRRRLLEQGVIESRARGHVSFALPLLREYLPVYLEGR